MNAVLEDDVLGSETESFSDDFSEESKESFRRFLEDLGRGADRSCGTPLSHANSHHTNHSNW